MCFSLFFVLKCTKSNRIPSLCRFDTRVDSQKKKRGKNCRDIPGQSSAQGTIRMRHGRQKKMSSHWNRKNPDGVFFSVYTIFFFFFSPHTGAKKKKKRNRFLHRKGKPMFITREHHLHCILFKSLLISVLFLSFFRVSYQWHNKRVECSCQSPENKEETYPFYAVLRFVFFFSFYFRF